MKAEREEKTSGCPDVGRNMCDRFFPCKDLGLRGAFARFAYTDPRPFTSPGLKTAVCGQEGNRQQNSTRAAGQSRQANGFHPKPDLEAELEN